MNRVPKNRHAYRDAVLSKDGPTDSTARLVALALTMCMDARSLESFARIELLAELTGLSERTVSTALGKLRREGWIEERTKARGRDFWLKYRRATLPDRLPADSSGSRSHGHPETIAGTRRAGLPAIDGTTACKTLHGLPARIADDPDSEILENDPEQNPPTPLRKGGGMAMQRRSRSPERLAKQQARAAFSRACSLIDHVNGSNLTWEYVTQRAADDPAISRAIDAAGGHRKIADRDRYTSPQIERDFVTAYFRATIE